MDNKIVTRMPPSPTGHLHIGTVRTALFNYLFAKHHGGEMVFRIEDTDKERSKKEFETEIIEGLKWLGIEWANKIVRQSERSNIYRKYLEKAIAYDKAYISKEPSKNNPEETVNIVRLRNPNKKVTFTDLIRGEITFDTTELGDVVIARSIDDALYHFVVVVDDFEMGVTHVLRGEDHISNTPRQILIQEALDIKRPIYAHLPLILAPDRSKLSKRNGVIGLSEYIEKGFLKESIVNYLALLGWNPGTEQELFTMPELIKQFDIAKMQKSGAIFDIQKFLWINRQYILKLSNKEYFLYAKRALPESITSLKTYTDDLLDRLLPVIKERASSAEEIHEAGKAGEYDFVFTDPIIDPDLLKWKNDKLAEEK